LTVRHDPLLALGKKVQSTFAQLSDFILGSSARVLWGLSANSVWHNVHC
jgi:hypothetical protein